MWAVVTIKLKSFWVLSKYTLECHPLKIDWYIPSWRIVVVCGFQERLTARWKTVLRKEIFQKEIWMRKKSKQTVFLAYLCNLYAMCWLTVLRCWWIRFQDFHPLLSLIVCLILLRGLRSVARLLAVLAVSPSIFGSETILESLACLSRFLALIFRGYFGKVSGWLQRLPWAPLAV